MIDGSNGMLIVEDEDEEEEEEDENEEAQMPTGLPSRRRPPQLGSRSGS